MCRACGGFFFWKINCAARLLPKARILFLSSLSDSYFWLASFVVRLLVCAGMNLDRKRLQLSVLEVVSGKIHGWLCELIECLINLTISCSVRFFFAAPLCCFCVCLLDVTCLFVSSKTVLLVTCLLDAASVCASARYVCFCDECEETGAVVHSPVFCPFLANVNRWLLRCRWLANGGE